MRIDTFVTACYLLLSSLVLMVFSHGAMLMNIAFGGVLLSLGMFACEDLLDRLFACGKASKKGLEA